jgi:hypothetical protein
MKARGEHPFKTTGLMKARGGHPSKNFWLIRTRGGHPFGLMQIPKNAKFE